MAERGVPISEAAQLMNMSVDALRKRVQRHSVKAYKDREGKWRVVLPDQDGGDSLDVDGTEPETVPSAVDATRRSGGLMAVQEVLAPFIAELGTVREELGREKEKREQVERERDRLRLEVAQLRSIQRHEQRAAPEAAPAVVRSDEESTLANTERCS